MTDGPNIMSPVRTLSRSSPQQCKDSLDHFERENKADGSLKKKAHGDIAVRTHGTCC